MTIKDRIFETEHITLSEYAAFSDQTLGRETPISNDDLRTDYMRDRDRIIHSKSFRRLKDKTQVFLYPDNSHYRTRLTHTMEVSQIARTISRALRLNEDLTEAIALGHDLGHTPFGHAGERVIRTFIKDFEHNVQSLRVVEVLEREGKGLNLTKEVRDGIFNHKKGLKPMTLEGMVVNYSDRIAYLSHDIDDAIRAGLLSEQDLPKECCAVLGIKYGDRIERMICDIVNVSLDKPYVSMSAEFEQATDELREFMFTNIYTDSPAKSEEKKVVHIISQLFEFYLEHYELIPDVFRKNDEKDGKAQCIADYICGMTDKFVVAEFGRLFIPENWKEL